MKDEADAYVERVKHDVLQYADDMLGYLSGSLQSALQAVNDNRASVNAERESVMSSRPQRDMELLAMEEEEDEEISFEKSKPSAQAEGFLFCCFIIFEYRSERQYNRCYIVVGGSFAKVSAD